MYIFICIYLFFHISVYTYIYICMYMYVCVSESVYIFVYMYMHIYILSCCPPLFYFLSHTLTHLHTHTFTHSYTHTHTYAYTHTYKLIPYQSPHAMCGRQPCNICDTATHFSHCSTLQRTATHCNILQPTATLSRRQHHQATMSHGAISQKSAHYSICCVI